MYRFEDKILVFINKTTWFEVFSVLKIRGNFVNHECTAAQNVDPVFLKIYNLYITCKYWRFFPDILKISCPHFSFSSVCGFCTSVHCTYSVHIQMTEKKRALKAHVYIHVQMYNENVSTGGWAQVITTKNNVHDCKFKLLFKIFSFWSTLKTLTSIYMMKTSDLSNKSCSEYFTIIFQLRITIGTPLVVKSFVTDKIQIIPPFITVFLIFVTMDTICLFFHMIIHNISHI